MSENTTDPAFQALESRARALFQDSVAGLDMRVQSRLTRARHTALEAAAKRRSFALRLPVWTPVVGAAAAAVLGVALWMGLPSHNGASVQTNLEDLDMVASSDSNAAAPMEMLQDDFDFYDYADKATAPKPAA